MHTAFGGIITTDRGTYFVASSQSGLWSGGQLNR